MEWGSRDEAGDYCLWRGDSLSCRGAACFQGVRFSIRGPAVLTSVCVQAFTTPHNIPLALRLVENLCIGYNDAPGPSKASLLGVGKGISGI